MSKVEGDGESKDESAEQAERVLKLGLRVIATISFSAVIFVAAPYSWMNAIHAWSGLGELPEEPIVGYLARSNSAFYALLAGLIWVISFDLRRHGQVLLYLGVVFILLGITFFFVDYLEGMPAYWVGSEGSITILYGVVLLVLMRKARLSERER